MIPDFLNGTSIRVNRVDVLCCVSLLNCVRMYSRTLSHTYICLFLMSVFSWLLTNFVHFIQLCKYFYAHSFRSYRSH